ncbi:MAG: rRNA maturation RNase YbeY [Lachnospiraceae bacterium]|nr:rRNA maturation RNase YbeY [Lachnospiraceae bacterium]
MTCYVEYSERVEKEANTVFPFSLEETAAQVMEAVLESEQCPYDAVVNVLLTDNAQIREYNRQYRETDRETDVLSFPNLEYGKPADFGFAEEEQADCFDPDSGELLLGDIILSADHVVAQAQEYGHSLLREFAFLTAHSMFHLCGYDHMTPEEAAVMERKQEEVLEQLHITRDL